MGQFLIVGLLFSAVCACLGRPQEPVAPAADPTTVDPAPAAATPAPPAGDACTCAPAVPDAATFTPPVAAPAAPEAPAAPAAATRRKRQAAEPVAAAELTTAVADVVNCVCPNAAATLASDAAAATTLGDAAATPAPAADPAAVPAAA